MGGGGGGLAGRRRPRPCDEHSLTLAARTTKQQKNDGQRGGYRRRKQLGLSCCRELGTPSHKKQHAGHDSEKPNNPLQNRIWPLWFVHFGPRHVPNNMRLSSFPQRRLAAPRPMIAGDSGRPTMPIEAIASPKESPVCGPRGHTTLARAWRGHGHTLENSHCMHGAGLACDPRQAL
eukprot:gene11312-biopygen10898